jgi:hypothetical protein
MEQLFKGSAVALGDLLGAERLLQFWRARRCQGLLFFDGLTFPSSGHEWIIRGDWAA